MRISDWSSDVCSSDLACDATGYDLLLLQRRFGAGYEQVAHRLTKLQRVGARGLPFFMLRLDLAGHDRKRVALGKSVSVCVDFGGRRLIQKTNVGDYLFYIVLINTF